RPPFLRKMRRTCGGCSAMAFSTMRDITWAIWNRQIAGPRQPPGGMRQGQRALCGGQADWGDLRPGVYGGRPCLSERSLNRRGGTGMEKAIEVVVSVEEVAAYFGELEDPRSEVNRKHPLVSVVTIAVMAVLAGADGPTAIARWARLK